MKKFLFLFVTIIAMGSLLSCEDNEDVGVVNSSSLQIYGQNYALTSGVIWHGSKFITTTREDHIFLDTYYDEEQGMEVTDEVVGFKTGANRSETGNFMLSLYGDGLAYNPELSTTMGVGALLCIHFSSSDVDKLVSGKYTFSTEKKPNTFIAYSSSSFDIADLYSTSSTITSGEIDISMEGEDYRIKFEGKTSFGANVKVEYLGPLAQINVTRDPVATIENVSLYGLTEWVSATEYFFGESAATTTHDFQNAGLFSTARGSSESVNKSKGGSDNIDIALFNDEDNNSLYFDSPLKIRTLFDHDDLYTFRCHTIYQKAPSSFMDSDFENISNFDFDVTEERVEFRLDDFQSGYVFFETGNGNKGVIKVKRITPAAEVTAVIIPGMWWVIQNVFPCITMDVKCLSNFPNPAIR